MARGKVVEHTREGKSFKLSRDVLDTTELEYAEEKLFHISKVFMDAVDPIFIRDLEGTVIELNRAAEQTYGWCRTELIGKSIKTIVPPDLHALAQEIHERCIQGEKLENVEAIHATKSGATVPVLLTLYPISSERGEPVGVVTTVKDLSNLKRIQEMFPSQTEALERSNKDLEEFAYIAAHELREPLIGVATYLKVLERYLTHKVDAQAYKLIARAVAAVTRMDRLIQSLLWHSSLASETKHLEPTDCNVVLEEALSTLRSALEDREATIKNEPLPTVMANPSLLVQVFQNLIGNAIKFVGDESLEIYIGASLEESEWKFFVKDNGMGIEPPYFDRIFRIFQRVDSIKDRPGTGIGLANCKKIVEHHRGRIWVESSPGKGSTFFFTIPVGTPSVT